MVFSSVIFLFVFLPIVFILYYSIGLINMRIKNFILLLFSLLFYAWGEPKNIVLLIISCFANYLFGLIIHYFKNHYKAKKIILIIALVFNLSLLFVFKYLNFMIENFYELLQTNAMTFDNLVLPVGISFYTLYAISYIIDIYRGEAEVQKNPCDLALYVTLFPKLMAGPIVCYNKMQEQLKRRKETIELFSEGVCRFIVGLAKKIIIADAFAVVADNVYGLSQLWHTQYLVPASLAWIGAFAYTFQIYFDFSGYSDMALGLGKMFGFRFEENFNYPFVSKSIREFWSRWHISLTNWFKKYIYFPLGGSYVDNKDQLVRNLTIVWLITGIWHGANWKFMLWAVWNLIFVLIERFIRIDDLKCPIFFKRCYTLMVITFGWVLFRAENIEKFIEYIKNMFCLNNNGFFSSLAWAFLRENMILIIIAIIACIPPSIWKTKIKQLLEKAHIELKSEFIVVCYPAVMICLFFISVIYLVRSGDTSFIYFSF